MNRKAASEQSVEKSSSRKKAVLEPTATEALPGSSNDALPEPYLKLKRLVEAGHLAEAQSFAKSRSADALMKNALGACLMRSGQFDEAVRLYRTLVLKGTSLEMQETLPTIYKTNFATALLLVGQVAGGVGVLDEIPDENHPSVQKLKAAIQHWQSQLSLVQKLAWYCGIDPKRPVVLDFPPGDLV